MLYPPPHASGMPHDEPVPEHLPDVGSAFPLADGRVGIVRHYQWYHHTQTDFPVMFGNVVSMWSMRGRNDVNAWLRKNGQATVDVDQMPLPRRRGKIR